MKTLLIIDDDPEVKELWERMKTKEAFFEKRMDAIKADAKKAVDDFHNDRTKDWDQLAEFQAIKNKLPNDYSSETYCIGINKEAGTVYAQRKEEMKHGIMDLLRDMFTGKD